MKKCDVVRLKLILRAKQSDTERALRNRDGITVEKSADEVEDTERAIEREITIQNLSRESRLLREIRGALRRLDEGVFGVCLHCEQEIGRKRLEAVPWTPLCLSCQEAADHGDEDVIESSQAWLAHAA